MNATLTSSDWYRRLRGTILSWFGVILALGCLFVGIYFLLPERRPRSQTFTFAAGSKSGLRYQIANRLNSALAPARVQFGWRDSKGSNDSLQSVNDGKLDFALVQGAIASHAFPNVREVAVMQIEPLHMLVSQQHASAVNEHLLALRGKRINLSSPGSGTNALGLEMLRFIGLSRDKDFEATEFSYAELEQMTPENGLPDVVFSVSSLPSPIADHLIDRYGYQIIELPFAESFRLGRQESDDMEPAIIERRRIVEATIPAYAYSVEPPIPSRPIKTLGARLHLVSNVKTPQDAIQTVTRAIYDTSIASLNDPAITMDLINTSNEFPLHAGTQAYLFAKSPIAAEHVIEVTEQLVGIVGATLGAIFFLLQWVKRARENRRDQDFVDCIERIVHIERRALQFESDESMTVDDLIRMQNELGDIKQQLLERYRTGVIRGADLLSSFLKHANDASEVISRIVLHERAPKPLDANATQINTTTAS